MKRTRKRAFGLSAGLLSGSLAIALLAPAAGAVNDLPEGDDVADEADVQFALVGVTGEHRYERAGLKYKKEVATYRTEYTYDKLKWVPGVKEYRYSKQIKEPVTETRYDWERTEHRWKTIYKEQKQLKGWKFFDGSWTNQGVPGNSWHDVPEHLQPPRSDQVAPTGTINGPLYGLPHHARNVAYRYDISYEEFYPSEDGYAVGPPPDGKDWGSPIAQTTVQHEGPKSTSAPAGNGWTKVEDSGEEFHVGWGDWRFLEDGEPHHNLIDWGPRRTWLPASIAPGGPWQVGVAKELGGVKYRYVQFGAWQWKDGTNTWITVKEGIGPTTSPPHTGPFPGFGGLYKYDNVQSSEVFDGWKTYRPFGWPILTGWLNAGDSIPTVFGTTVEPGEEFDVHGKTYRYDPEPALTRSSSKWVTEAVAGDGPADTLPGGWTYADESKVYDAEPNEVRVTINGDEVVESFGTSYTESFELDHGDTYLVEQKLHGDEDWATIGEGTADCGQPEALVESSEWEGSELLCTSEEIELTRTVTTTPFTWDPEARTWVEDTENVVEETETDTRALTEEELAWQASEACVEVEGEVIEQEPEVEEEPEVEPAAVERVVETKVLAETRELPRTGASVLALLAAGMLALFTGAGTLMNRRRKR